MEHVEDNVRTHSPAVPLADDEMRLLERVADEFAHFPAVPCTACRYCMPCPVGVEIPRIFGIYNQYKVSGNKWQFNSHYNGIPEDSRADSCVNCGRCMKHCPQKIKIPDMLKQIAQEVK